MLLDSRKDALMENKKEKYVKVRLNGERFWRKLLDAPKNERGEIKTEILNNLRGSSMKNGSILWVLPEHVIEEGEF